VREEADVWGLAVGGREKERGSAVVRGPRDSQRRALEGRECARGPAWPPGGQR